MNPILLLVAHGWAASWRSPDQLARLKAFPDPEFCFVVMGDSRQERRAALKAVYPVNGVFQRLLQRAKPLGCDFTVHLGDIVQTGEPGEYEGLTAFLEGERLPSAFLVAIGNHEVVVKGGLEGFKKTFGPDHFSFDHKGFRFIVLNSARRRLGAEQSQWLKKALDTPLRKVVFSHMPPMPLQGWHDGALAKMMARRMNTILRDDGSLTKLLSERKVERFYGAHIHAFGQADFRGVRYVLSGGAGSPLYPWYFAKHQFFHSVVVRVDARGRLTEEVCPPEGKCRPASEYEVFPEANFLEK